MADADEAPRDLLLRGQRQRREHRDAVEQRELGRRWGGGGVDSAQSTPRQEHERGQERPGGDQRAPDSKPADQGRRGDRTDAHSRRRSAEHHAEDAAEEIVADQALQDGLAGDVLDRVPDADHRQQEQRRHPVGDRCDERNGDSPEQQADGERDRQLPTHERHRGESADEGSRSDRAGEEADPPSSRMEEPEGDDDGQHVQRAADDRLRDEERNDQTRVWLARQQPEAGGEVPRRTVMRESETALDVDRCQHERTGDSRHNCRGVRSGPSEILRPERVGDVQCRAGDLVGRDEHGATEALEL